MHGWYLTSFQFFFWVFRGPQRGHCEKGYDQQEEAGTHLEESSRQGRGLQLKVVEVEDLKWGIYNEGLGSDLIRVLVEIRRCVKLSHCVSQGAVNGFGKRCDWYIWYGYV